jgi:branched-chain amino acid transport system substrate-binding protein
MAARVSSKEETVGIKFGSDRSRSAIALIALVLGLSMFMAACGGDDDGGWGGGGDGGGFAGEQGKTAAAKCGAGNGKKASGEPIKLGAIATKQPGTDFSEIPRTAQAFFKCVNDNGGIKGRPVELIIETEQTDPGQAAAAAKKLIETEKVVGIIGNTSLIECAVNAKYYEQNNFYVIGSGIHELCYAMPNFAAVNMGPRYSSDGAVQYAIRAGAKKIAFDQSNVPGNEYIEGGPRLVAKDAGIPIETFKDNVPIQDANSIALKLVQAAGDDGAVVLNFTPPEALKILQAAQNQGLQNRVVTWACSTPCNTDFIADALGPQWDGKLGVNAELNLVSADAPDTNLYKEVLKKYAPGIPLGSFSQMGFVEAKIATDTMMKMDGEYTAETVNEAFKNIKNFKTDILCNPWYYGDAPLHIPNNVDRTVVPEGDVMVEKEDCFPISDVDPNIKRVRDIEKEDPSLVGKG